MSLHRISLVLVALFALLIGSVTSELRAQGCPANVCNLSFSASVSVEAVISCSVTRPSFDFGSHLSSAGIIASNEANHVRARCTIDPTNGIVDISFPTLPSVLTRTGGPGTLPIEYGAESARAYDCDGSCGPLFDGFDPALGLSRSISSGVLTLALGENGINQPWGEVRVDLTNAAAGTYTGSIVAQVALR